MTIVATLLALIARHGRLALVAGLVAGLTLPDLAALIRPWLPHLVALLLFLTAFRIGLRQAAGSLAEARSSLLLVTVFQLAMPVAALVIFWSLGLMATTFAIAVMLMLTAPGVSGGAAFTALLGRDPAPALRVQIAGLAVFPLTVMPILWVTPALGSMVEVLAASARLLVVITIASAFGFALRRLIPAPDLRQVDGLNAMALFVMPRVIPLTTSVSAGLSTSDCALRRVGLRCDTAKECGRNVSPRATKRTAFASDLRGSVLGMNPRAPISIARSAPSARTCPENSTTDPGALAATIRSTPSTPFIPGMSRSSSSTL